MLTRARRCWPAAIPIILATLPILHAQNQSHDIVRNVFTVTGSGVFIAISIALFILNVIPLVWVAKDARTRGLEEAELWVALVLFFSVIGLVGYLICRPKGRIVKCPHCGNNRRQVMAACPHCHTS